MKWVEVFPAYRIILEVVHGSLTYLFLMNLSFALLLAIPIVAFLITPRFRTLVRWQVSVAVGLIALILGAALFCYALFTDFGLVTTEALGNALEFFAKSVLGFAFFYCVGLPVLTGFALFLFARSMEIMIEAFHSLKS